MIHINLIPNFYLEEDKKKQFLTLITIAVAGIFLLFFILGGIFFLKSKILAKNVRALEAEAARYEDINRQVETLENQRSQIQSKINVVEKLLFERFELARFLEELVFSLPHETWLTSLMAQNAQGVFQIQIQASSLTLTAIIEWLNHLEKNPKVSSLNLGTITNTQTPSESASNFQISFQYKSQ